MRSASLPIARSTSEISNRAVGQTSGQRVKPKKISVGLPFRLCSVTDWPFWSVSRNGPPIEEGGVTFESPPNSHITTRRPIARLPANAAKITRGRLVFAVMALAPDAGPEVGAGRGLRRTR